MYFQYGQEETEYLSSKDEKLGAVIAQVGRVNREVDTDLFSAVVHHIVGQQISTKAQATIWQRMRGALGTVDAEHILEAGNEQLQLLGISCRKAEYITDFARKIQNGEFDLEGIWQKPDEEVIRAAKTVCAHDFIMEMENGYETEVNERGSRLSAGQRQLISFARALLADPKILILDEATSSIDTETEHWKK